ncbi:MAG: sulfite exporter TauE/SafE family protein [Rhodospirillales bacterium]|nr:sulfite exporter TauE/SafE family protein [Rhodospirillales bacterium]
MSILLILAGVFTGLLLGILGSGGSIITMPALMYLLDVAPKPAIAMSLGIVGITASIATLQHWRKGNVNLPVALVFSVFGAGGTFAGAKVGVIMPELLQLGMFAAIMYVAAYRMLKPKAIAPESSIPGIVGGGVAVLEAPLVSARLGHIAMGHIAMHGIVVGVLTGMVGVGGGFLIIPALVLLSGLGMKEAVGTSLAIVTAKSFAGLAGYAGAVEIDYTLMGGFTAVAVVSGIVGGSISTYIPAALLKKGFAVFLVLVATYIVFKEFGGW